MSVLSLFPGQHLFRFTDFTYVSALFAVIFIFTCIFFSYKTFKTLLSLKFFILRYFWFGLTLFLLTVFFLSFPGYVTFDDAFIGMHVFDGRAQGTQSLSYSFFLAILYLIGAGSLPAPLIFILYFSYLSTKVLAQIDRSGFSSKGKILTASVFVLLALHPFNQLLLLSHTRDTLFALANLHLALIIFEKKHLTYLQIFCISIFLILLGDLREEGKIFLITVPFLFFFLKDLKLKRFFVFLSLLATLSYLFYFNFKESLRVVTVSSHYQITLYINPLGAILRNKGLQIFTPEETEKMNRVINLKQVYDQHNPLEIDPFHNGAVNRNLTPVDWAEFKKISLQLFLNNREVFFNSKYVLFSAMLNAYEVQGFITGNLLQAQNEMFKDFFEKIKYEYKNPEKDSLELNYMNSLLSFAGRPLLKTFHINTLIFPLFLVILCLLSFRCHRLQFAAAIIALRLPAVILLAPAGYIKYVYTVLLFFIFFLPIFILNYRMLTQAKNKIPIDTQQP